MHDFGPARTGRGWLTEAGLAHLLARLRRREAELAHLLDATKEVVEISWNGEAVSGTLVHPLTRVTLENDDKLGVSASCTLCLPGQHLCGHAGAVVLQWIRVRDAVRAKGPGTVWRRGAAQPFLAPKSSGLTEVDLTHLSHPDELADALQTQLSMRAAAPSSARLEGDRVQVVMHPLSGGTRVIEVAARVIPYLLPDLKALGVTLEGDLGDIAVSEERLLPRLRASVAEDGVLVIEPGYRLAGEFVTAKQVDSDHTGSWVRLGTRLHRIVAPATSLIPYRQRGTTRLCGDAAATFLERDHFALFGEKWYEPQGVLSTTARFPRPELVDLVVEETSTGAVRLVPVYAHDQERLDWKDISSLLELRFIRRNGTLLRPPQLSVFLDAGFKLTRTGLTGDRNAYVRALTELRMTPAAAPASLAPLGDALVSEASQDAPPMPGLRSLLRPYQARGAAWLWRLYRTGLGALLADDMGLGKTHQTMALMCAIRAETPDALFLIVCPRGVLEHWRHLMASFAPDLRLQVFHGTRRRLRSHLRGTVVLTTYEVALRDAADLAVHTWEVLVLDEAQRIKNPRTKGARVIKTIPARFRLALSGTPLENRLLELWSIFDQIIPGYLGSERSFRLAHRNPTGERLASLRRHIAPFTLRRLKEQVLDDLPEISEEILYADLAPRQRSLYREIESAGAAALIDRVLDAEQSVPYMHIFALLTRLKQACDHPGLVDRRLAFVEPGKVALLDEILDEALSAGRRIVIFSQYVEMITLLERHLRHRDIDHLVLTGQTRDRGAVVSRFNSAKYEPILLASLLASGVGIDLTAASVVVHYDRWWNPARENQATDRVHRMGQHEFVQVFKLVTSNTIEERIDQIIRRKADLARDVVTPTEADLRRFSRSDLAEILGYPSPSESAPHD